MSVLPHGGPAIAIMVAGIFFGVIAAIVALETERHPVMWAAVGFVASIVIASAMCSVA